MSKAISKPDRTSDTTQPRRTVSQPQSRPATDRDRRQKQPNVDRSASRPATKPRQQNATREAPKSRRSAQSSLTSKPSEQQQSLRFSPPARRFDLQRWFDSLTVEKGLAIAALLVAVTIFLPFACDLVTGWPFRWASLIMDFGFAASSFAFGMICWNTLRHMR